MKRLVGRILCLFGKHKMRVVNVNSDRGYILRGTFCDYCNYNTIEVENEDLSVEQTDSFES